MEKSDNTYLRAKLVVDIREYSIERIINLIDEKNTKFLAVVIDELNRRARNQGVCLFDYLKSQFNATNVVNIKPENNLHEKNQEPIHRAFDPNRRA